MGIAVIENRSLLSEDGNRDQHRRATTDLTGFYSVLLFVCL